MVSTLAERERDAVDAPSHRQAADEDGEEILEARHGEDALHELGARTEETAAAVYTSRDLQRAEEEDAKKWGVERKRRGEGRTVDEVTEEARESQGVE